MRYLFILIISGVLFGQDVLNLKSGESLEGVFYGKVGKDLVFQSLGDAETKKYPIWDVTSIKTVNMEYFYPFDILTKEEEEEEEKRNLEISPQNGLIIVGGMNLSNQTYEEDTDGMNIKYMNGYNLYVEGSFSIARFGVGINQRGVKLNQSETSMGMTVSADGEQNLNYLTIHFNYPLLIKEKEILFLGLQLGKGLRGEAKIKQSISGTGLFDGTNVDSYDIDAEDMDLEYGLFLGGDYIVNDKIGIRVSYFKGLSETVEDSKAKNNTISFSFFYSLK